MKAEYKRDLSGNYLVLYEEEEPDTSSYQMRMLVGNTIPSVLKCGCRAWTDSLWSASTLLRNSLYFRYMRKRRLDMRTFR